MSIEVEVLESYFSKNIIEIVGKMRGLGKWGI